MRVSIRAGSAFLVTCAALALNIVGTAQPAPSVNLDQKGPRVGERVPPFSGVDQRGRTQTLESVLAADGAMLVFYRSADW